MMIAKLHKTLEGRTILAVCDSDIIGKRYEEGELQLDLTSGFYRGEEMDEARIKGYFKVVHVVNLVGENAVELGIKEGLVDKDHIMKVDGIPHAQCSIVRD